MIEWMLEEAMVPRYFFLYTCLMTLYALIRELVG